MMYKLIAVCCSLLLSISICSAQNKKKESTDGKSLLWKISGKGLTKPSYLFGTIHLICPDDYIWTPAMQKALDSSEKVALEMDMDDPALQSQMVAGMMLPDGKTLKDFYTEEEYNQLQEATAKIGIPLEGIQALNPFAIVSFLYLKAVTCTVPDSYEGNIMKLAKKDNKEIVGLESIEEQLKVVNSLNSDTLARQILTIASDLDSFKNTLSSIIASYKQQDLPALYELFISSPDYKNALDELLFNRNRKWIPVIKQLTTEQPTFIAVGAGHLWGDNGVIELLKKEGYQVEIVR